MVICLSKFPCDMIYVISFIKDLLHNATLDVLRTSKVQTQPYIKFQFIIPKYIIKSKYLIE